MIRKLFSTFITHFHVSKVMRKQFNTLIKPLHLFLCDIPDTFQEMVKCALKSTDWTEDMSLSPSSISFQLCGLRQVTFLLCASKSPSKTWIVLTS